jgi:hypothetical protein
MKDILGILVDGQPQFEFDRDRPLPDEQRGYLEQMDRKMDQGFVLQGRRIEDPDLRARARFVAANLANALAASQDNLAMAMTTWLGVRCPELKQVRISAEGPGMKVDLDYEHPYQKPEPSPQVVTFNPTRH